MAGHARYTALLDACVLYPVAMCDALMSVATTGLFAAKWTKRIEAEWMGALESSRPDLTGKLVVRRDSMREAIPGTGRSRSRRGRACPRRWSGLTCATWATRM